MRVWERAGRVGSRNKTFSLGGKKGKCCYVYGVEDDGDVAVVSFCFVWSANNLGLGITQGSWPYVGSWSIVVIKFVPTCAPPMSREVMCWWWSGTFLGSWSWWWSGVGGWMNELGDLARGVCRRLSELGRLVHIRAPGFGRCLIWVR